MFTLSRWLRLFRVARFQITNLRAPWGNCSEWELDYFPTYSMSTCKMDVDNKFVRRQCRCRSAEMPRTGDGESAHDVTTFMQVYRVIYSNLHIQHLTCKRSISPICLPGSNEVSKCFDLLQMTFLSAPLSSIQTASFLKSVNLHHINIDLKF